MKDVWVPKTTEDCEAVRSELEKILASEHFRSSTRYPAFLRHIVEKTLKGEVADLKERTIGVEVFHRAPEYNTADDPVVRVCGSEVRRRIAQFYAHAEFRRGIEIEVPPGGYVTQFWRRTNLGNGIQEVTHGQPPSPDSIEEPALQGQLNESTRNERSRSQLRNWILSFCAGALAALLVAAAIAMIVRERSNHDPLMLVWNPLLTNQYPALISVGRPHAPGEEDLTSSQQLSIANRILQPSYRVSITSVSAISHVTAVLDSHKKPFEVRVSESSGLEDMHQRPLVLIAGNDNKWTVLLLKPLRFHFGEFSSIVDDEHPGQTNWQINWSEPYQRQTADYAIVGRFYSPTTQGPVIVIAGISSTGTEAAGEFMTSSESLAALARNAHGSLEKNFEAVLKVEVVGGNPGAVSVVASQFW